MRELIHDIENNVDYLVEMVNINKLKTVNLFLRNKRKILVLSESKLDLFFNIDYIEYRRHTIFDPHTFEPIYNEYVNLCDSNEGRITSVKLKNIKIYNIIKQL